MLHAQGVVGGAGVGVGIGVAVGGVERRGATVDLIHGGVQVERRLYLIGGGGRHGTGRHLQGLRLTAGADAGGEAGEPGALGVFQVAVGGQGELAVAGIDGLVALGEAEKAAAVDAQIQITAGGFQGAVGEILQHRGHAHALAHLGTGVDVGELRAGPFEPHGLGVGDVVTDHVEIGGGRVKTTECL